MLTKYTLVDVLVDRHSDRQMETPLFIVTFDYNSGIRARLGRTSQAIITGLGLLVPSNILGSLKAAIFYKQ